MTRKGLKTCFSDSRSLDIQRGHGHLSSPGLFNHSSRDRVRPILPQAANRYYEKLKPSCIETGVSHEERAAKRQEEIESLQEALRILSGEDVA